MFRKVAVGISGGVDSAVAAFLLKNKGLEVAGVFMKNWDLTDEVGSCTSESDLKDAYDVCKVLKIPLHEINFVKEYWNFVFEEFLSDYESGYTPNPDILCNKYIKFNSFFEYCTKNLGADAIATGHYANSSFGEYLQFYNPSEKPKLLKACDEKKDQTFFLSQISGDALGKTMFPVGPLCKSEVRSIASRNEMDWLSRKKESTGICFIGNRDFQEFISQYIKSQRGNFLDIDTGEKIGEHDGKHHWTVGQRCRIPGLKSPHYIAEKCCNNDIFVASYHDHPALYKTVFHITRCHWIHSEPKELQSYLPFRCEFRFQHGKPLVGCTLKKTGSSIDVFLDSPLRALTPGQYGVFYKNSECLGSGRIEATLFSTCAHKDYCWRRHLSAN